MQSAGGGTEEAGGLEGMMRLMQLQTENINRFVEAQTDNLSRTTGVTKRVPPVFTANSPDLLYDEIRAVQLHWALQRVVHRRQWFEEARSSATGRAKLYSVDSKRARSGLLRVPRSSGRNIGKA